MASKSNLLKFIEIKNVKKSDFYRITGLPNGFLDKNNNISSENIEIIISKFPDINIEWLITGDGEMLKSEVDPKKDSEIKKKYDILIEKYSALQEKYTALLEQKKAAENGSHE